MLKRYGLFFCLFALYVSFVSAAEVNPVDLEPIIVSREQYQTCNSYSLASDISESLPFDSVTETLSVLPVDLQSRYLKDGIQTDFSLRGSNFQGVLLLLDGQRINDPQTAHYNSDIPLTKEDVDKVKVMPGVSSALFGPDAIGGAINISVKKPKQDKFVLEGSYGSHNTQHELLSITQKTGPFGFRASAEKDKSNGFHYDTDFDNFIATLNSQVDLPYGDFNLNFGYEDKKYGAFDFYTPGLNYPSREWTKTYLINTGFDLNKGGLIIRPNFLWRRHYDKFMLDETQKRSTYLNHHRTDVYTPNVYLQKEIEILGNIGLGLEYGDERITSTNLGKHNRVHKSIFVDESKELNSKFSWGISARADDFNGFDTVCTGSTMVKYEIFNGGTLGAGVSRSMRVPSFTELYYDDPTTVGNNQLAAEKSLTYQIGYEHSMKNFSGGLTFFFRQEHDFIDWIKYTPSEVKWHAENISESDVFGPEAYMKFKVNNCLSLETNYSYINKDSDENGLIYKYGPNYSKHLFNSVLNFNFPFGMQSITLNYKKKPSRDGWMLIGMHLSYNFNKHLQTFFNVTNLGNAKYEEIVGVPQAGRWLEGGLRVEW